MNFGLVVPNFCGGVRGREVPSLTRLSKFAQISEELGFEGLWVIDHLLVASPIYSTTWLSPTVTLAALASKTSRISLGTSAMVLPIQSPLAVAKEIASLDVLSNGRVKFGVVNGWWDKEFEASNIPKTERGRRMEEYVQIIRRLWTEDSVTFRGNFYELNDIDVQPKPLQKPHPPIWIGGGSAVGKADDVYKVKASSVLRRIAKYGDGWISRAYTDLQSLSRDWRTLQNYMKEFGKDISRMTFAHITWMYLTEGKSEGTARELFSRCLSLPFEDIKKEAIIGSKPEIMKKIEELVNIDVTYLIIWPTGEDYELLKFLSRDVLASFT